MSYAGETEERPGPDPAPLDFRDAGVAAVVRCGTDPAVARRVVLGLEAGDSSRCAAVIVAGVKKRSITNPTGYLLAMKEDLPAARFVVSHVPPRTQRGAYNACSAAIEAARERDAAKAEERARASLGDGPIDPRLAARIGGAVG